MKMNFICECNSLCIEEIDITADDLLEIRKEGCIIISDSCQCGPESTDKFIRQEDGYKVYRPNEYIQPLEDFLKLRK